MQEGDHPYIFTFHITMVPNISLYTCSQKLKHWNQGNYSSNETQPFALKHVIVHSKKKLQKFLQGYVINKTINWQWIQLQLHDMHVEQL